VAQKPFLRVEVGVHAEQKARAQWQWGDVGRKTPDQFIKNTSHLHLSPALLTT
jgi:hypothetical protein